MESTLFALYLNLMRPYCHTSFKPYCDAFKSGPLRFPVLSTWPYEMLALSQRSYGNHHLPQGENA